MKTQLLKLAAVALGLAAPFAVAALVGTPPPPPPAPSYTLPLEWDYPGPLLSVSMTFRVYSTTNVALPLADWPLVLTVTNQTWANVPTNADRGFYFVTASDGFGESLPSNAGAWPPLAPANFRRR